MHPSRPIALVLRSAAVVIAAACSAPSPPAPPAPAAPTANADSLRLVREAQLRADSIARAESMRRAADQRRADSIAAANAAAARDAETLRGIIVGPVHYDFDRADLRDDTRELLDAKVPILIANPALAIRVIGHTDDRGSGEYNLQLGQRRAAAARDYLVARGVQTARIELVSSGEERPLCQDKSEACWSQNRRAEFEITAGGTMLHRR